MLMENELNNPGRNEILHRFLASRSDDVTDAELLELFLASTAATPEARPLALRLLETFGSLLHVVHAPDYALGKIEGVTPDVLKSLALLCFLPARIAFSEIRERPLVSSAGALIQYLKLRMGGLHVEAFRVLYLDYAHHLLADEEMWRGTVNHTPAYPREIVKRALELGAGGVILVHNHPTGDHTPSKGDIDITTRILEALATVQVRLHDHVIITSGNLTSFRSFGLLGEAPQGETVPESDQLSLF